MKIDRIQIDGFGEYGGASLPPMDRPVTIFYGPNEAGKSTLLRSSRRCCSVSRCVARSSTIHRMLAAITADVLSSCPTRVSISLLNAIVAPRVAR